MYRQNIIKCLSKLVGPDDAKRIEEESFTISQDKHEHITKIYEIIGYLFDTNVDVEYVMDNIHHAGYTHPYYSKYDVKYTQASATKTKSAFKCRKCKSDETYFTQAQTRGGDEGMTTFVECSVCHYRWKM